MLSLKVEKIKVPFDADNLSGDVNAISYKTAINLNGDESMLYPTFDNKSTAIDNIKDQCSLVIGEMQDIYGLEKFSTSTWEDYYNIMHEYEENIFEAQNNDSISDEQDTKSQQIIKLRGFFDIYENYDTNDSILSEISKINMVCLLYTSREGTHRHPQELRRGCDPGDVRGSSACTGYDRGRHEERLSLPDGIYHLEQRCV